MGQGQKRTFEYLFAALLNKENKCQRSEPVCHYTFLAQAVLTSVDQLVHFVEWAVEMTKMKLSVR